jgi:hypothetical protein
MSGLRKLLLRNRSLFPQVVTKGSQQSSSSTHIEAFIISYNKHYMSDGNKTKTTFFKSINKYSVILASIQKLHSY